MGRSRQLTSLQVGRGFATVMVVGHHVMSYVGRDERYWQRAPIAAKYNGLQLGVEYFFVLSGVVMLLAHWRDIDRWQSLKSYFWKRFRRIYPIYWMVLTVVVAEYTLRPAVGQAYQRNAWVILSGYLLVHIRSTSVNLPVAWTLFHEILFYLLFAFLLLKRRIGVSVLAIWFSLSILACVVRLPWFLGDYLISPLYLLFGLGMIAGYLLRPETGTKLGFLGAPQAALRALLLGAGLFLSAFVMAGLHEELGILVELLAGFGSAAIIFGAGRMEERRGLPFPAWTRAIGDASYAIYLIHYPFLMFIAPGIYRASVKTSAPLVVPVLLMIISAVAAGYAVHIWVEKPVLGWIDVVSKRHSATETPALTGVS